MEIMGVEIEMVMETTETNYYKRIITKERAKIGSLFFFK